MGLNLYPGALPTKLMSNEVVVHLAKQRMKWSRPQVSKAMIIKFKAPARSPIVPSHTHPAHTALLRAALTSLLGFCPQPYAGFRMFSALGATDLTATHFSLSHPCPLPPKHLQRPTQSWVLPAPTSTTALALPRSRCEALGNIFSQMLRLRNTCQTGCRATQGLWPRFISYCYTMGHSPWLGKACVRRNLAAMKREVSTHDVCPHLPLPLL